ncbi:MAG: 2-C-methyl-D-erythritol 2,4-cyclodiphosphate synthase [Treponema sp.]|nr:2-C-methyl-D-erythritol 2,4-cyclodiphosphate synthase [Treponema sp.]
MKITTTATSNLCVLITAAGSSTRMGGPVKKEYLQLESGTVLSTVTKKFLQFLNPKLIVITTPSSSVNFESGEKEAEYNVFLDPEVKKYLEENPETKIIFTSGGKSRQESVFSGLKAVKENSPFSSDFLVAVHDGARPFVSRELLQRTVEAAALSGAAFPGLEPTETQKEIDDQGLVTKHLKRKNLISVQTPQIFDFENLYQAHEKASGNHYEYTDDTEIWGKYCGPVSSVKGDPANIKITYPDDYKKERRNRMIHTGLGYDMHRLVPGRKLVLGGVEIPFEKGEEGHSDGDVLLHAVTDALLGASGLGDIGSFFPPEEAKWKDADSAMLLKTVWDKITEKGWKLENLDCVIKLEKPKFIPYREAVIKSIAGILGTEEDSVFVKAKTYEKTGNWENQIEAFATCLLSR